MATLYACRGYFRQCSACLKDVLLVRFDAFWTSAESQNILPDLKLLGWGREIILLLER